MKTEQGRNRKNKLQMQTIEHSLQLNNNKKESKISNEWH